MMGRGSNGLFVMVPAVLIGIALALILALGLRYRDLTRPRAINAEQVQRVRRRMMRVAPWRKHGAGGWSDGYLAGQG